MENSMPKCYFLTPRIYYHYLPQLSSTLPGGGLDSGCTKPINISEKKKWKKFGKWWLFCSGFVVLSEVKWNVLLTLWLLCVVVCILGCWMLNLLYLSWQLTGRQSALHSVNWGFVYIAHNWVNTRDADDLVTHNWVNTRDADNLVRT